MISRAKPRPASKARASRVVRRPANNPNAPEDIRDAVWRLKRESIVAAAVDLFYHQGYARTTLEQVADAIHVTKPFIYAHFKSKSDLLAEICMRGTRVSHESMGRALAQGNTPTAKLSAIAHGFLLAVLNHQAHAVIYSREEKELASADREDIKRLRREFDKQLVAVLEQGVSRGEFRIEDVGLTALAIVGIVAWSQMWYRSNGRLSKEEAAERVVSLVLSMVHATDARIPKGKKRVAQAA